MTSDVVLSAAMQNNLSSLANTSNLIDKTQLELSTGKKVNSALDNPQSYFASQSLTDSANDMSNLLDGIGQSIQAIQAANTGVTSMTTLVNQANSLATQAQAAITGAPSTASVTGNVSLTGSTALSTITGLASSGDKLIFNVTDPTGGTNKITSSSTAYSIATTSGETVQDLVDSINDLNTTDGLSSPAITASLTSSGQLKLEASNGGTMSVNFQSGTANTDADNLALATALGFGNIAKLNLNGPAAAGGLSGTVGFTSAASSNLTSNAFYTNATGTLAQGTTELSALKNASGTAQSTLVATDTLKLTVDGKTSADLLTYAPTGTATPTAATQTIQGLVEAINNDASIGSLVTASFDSTTGQISIAAKDPSATDVQFSFKNGTAAQDGINLGFGEGAGAPYGDPVATPGDFGQTHAAVIGDGSTEDVRFGAAAGSIASLQSQYNTTLSQIDSMAKDSGYQGSNLLAGDNLTTYFSADHTSSLVTQGVDFSSAGLGMTQANFQNGSDVGNAIDQTTTALSTLRNYGSTLSGNLSIMQDRQTFTSSMVTNLQTGSSDLTNADTNQLSANLLALQTQQQLGVDALSLASQANQSVLKLFG